MNELDRRFDYKTDAGSLKLLGILMVVLAPIAIVMSFQEGNDDIIFWGLHIRGPAAPWVIRLTAVVLLYFGAGMVRSAHRAQKAGKGVTLTSTGVVIVDRPEIRYQDISEISLEQFEKRPLLCLTHPGGKIGIARSRMKSQQEFDEMSAILAERTNRPSP